MAPNYRLVMSEKMGSIRKTVPCIVCCGRNKTLRIFHIHLSTAFYNRQMIAAGELVPMCHFCEKDHAVDNRTRQNVILTTSTLAGVQYIQGWGWDDKDGDPLHCNVEAIPGAKIVTLKKAWERAYMRNPLPIDTVLMAGLNDVKDTAKLYMDKYTMEEAAELVSEDILNSIKGLHGVILEHSKLHSVKDTLAVGTILHVPALYWHKKDGSPPTPDYTNLKTIIDRTNLKIEAYNIENGCPSAPKLHQSGERGKKRRYQFGAFREEEKSDMMHLKDTKRFKMAKSLVKYFRKSTARSQLI